MWCIHPFGSLVGIPRHTAPAHILEMLMASILVHDKALFPSRRLAARKVAPDDQLAAMMKSIWLNDKIFANLKSQGMDLVILSGCTVVIGIAHGKKRAKKKQKHALVPSTTTSLPMSKGRKSQVRTKYANFRSLRFGHYMSLPLVA